jgi:predicted acyltransferase
MKTLEMKTRIEPKRSFGQPATRLVSVDVLRGITIAFMILVNNGLQHQAYAQLEHSAWNGCTLTDLVFPTFLFLVGMTVVYSFESRLARGAPKSSLVVHTLQRAAVLFLFGFLLRVCNYFAGDNLRIYGVLQRIAVCFLIAGIFYLVDQRPLSKIVFVVVALIGYWILIRWTPIPGVGVPGRDFPLFDPTRNMGAFIDQHLFPGHLSRGLYDTEGLLGTLLPAEASTLLGMLTAMWLRSKHTSVQKLRGMLAAGVAGILLGLIWGYWFPLNKQLWTSSYVLFSAGCALVGLSLLYWAIDIKGWKKGWTYPWLVFGMNAITAYMISELLGSAMSLVHIRLGDAKGNVRHFYTQVFLAIPSPHLASLAYSISIVVVCFIPLVFMYRKRMFLKV